ncbi:hypothetical protein EJ04DRAFT_443530 [Polyplosphaeria fusca]|uniref:Uncharacterized protein n=1 Tax=Polyplosphaeria fusca TaxID=682080 RepID=A0A9P4QPC4_9PLEO|nr:hypothetical protein EJ04DRAFT_443530 [Polyplosphaeria fusca]
MPVFRSLLARQSPIASYQVTQRACLHQSIVRRAGKESTLHNEGRSEEVEKQKQDSLKDQKEGKGAWKEGLASDSESIVSVIYPKRPQSPRAPTQLRALPLRILTPAQVKADRGEAKTTEETIKNLQKEGEKVGKK